MLIKTYGQFWNPDIVEWGRPNRQGCLIGETKRGNKKYSIDYWNARGIYVLHADFKAVYVGQAFDTRLGPRLRVHLTDRFMGRWDMFSWFSVSSPRFTNRDVSDGNSQRQISTSAIVDTLEALGILIADPALNRKRERFSSAYEAIQPKGRSIKTVRTYLENIASELQRITQNIEE
jgi:hypothetical protein